MLNEKVVHAVFIAHHTKLDVMTGQMDLEKVFGHG